MKQVTTIIINAPVDKVAKAICSEAYNVEENTSRPDIVSASYELIDEQDSRLEFNVNTIEYGRTKTGRTDKSQRNPAKTNNVWNADRRTLTWTYEGSESHRVKVSGMVELHPQGNSTRAVYNTNIEVTIPLIGNKIAKLIAKAFDKAMVRVKPILQRHATK